MGSVAKVIRTLFKGAAPGTHWHQSDARISGFSASTRVHTKNAVVTHIGGYSYPSPYLSVSTSFAVARRYALIGPQGAATVDTPGYVYEIDLEATTSHVSLIDPVREIALGHTGVVSYEHDGDVDLIRQIAQGQDPSAAYQLGGSSRVPAVSADLRSLIFAVRDAELLIHGSLPNGAVIRRHDAY
jgi:hypothetical protein